MKIKYQATLLTVALALGSCASDEMFDDGTGSGTMGSVTKPGVEVSNVENVVKGAPSRASYNISDFLLDFYRAGEESPFMSSAYKDLNATVDLPAGDYTISVRSHNVKKAEWEKPYFTGKSEQFTIEAEKITTVKPITCKFSSIKVTVKFGEELKKVLGDDVEVTVVANDEGRLVFTPTETRAGYFEALDGSATMAVTFTGKVNGYTESFTRTFADVAEGQHRIITFNTGGDLPTPDAPHGTIVFGEGLKIDFSYTDKTIDGSVDPGSEDVIVDGEKDPGTLPDIPDPENPDNPDNPDNPKDEPITFGGNIENGKTYGTSTFNDGFPASIAVTAEKGIADFVVTIDSPDGGLNADELAGVGLAGTFSLVNDSQYFDSLGGLGLPTANAVKGQTSLPLDITKFMDLLNMLGETTNTFTMEVTDNEGNKSSLTFTLLGGR